MYIVTEYRGPATWEQRQREFIYILNGKIDEIKAGGYVHKQRYDLNGNNGGMRTREFAWLLGEVEFHLSYHELPENFGSASYRLRFQDFSTKGAGDLWTDLTSFGELDGMLRKERANKAYSSADRKAQRNRHKHEGETPSGLILVGLSGSKAYGLSHNGYKDPESGEQLPPSDTDIRGVFVVNTKALLMMGSIDDLVEQTKGADTVYNEVKKFMELCIQCNPERLELLAACAGFGTISPASGPVGFVSPDDIELNAFDGRRGIANKLGAMLVENRDMFLSKRLIKTYGGYAKQQLMRIERKEARRSKPAMHLIRLMLTGLNALKTGILDCDMSEYRDDLLAIRTGDISLSEVFEWHRSLEAEFAKAIERTTLPDAPDMERINSALLDIRRQNLDWGC